MSAKKTVTNIEHDTNGLWRGPGRPDAGDRQDGYFRMTRRTFLKLVGAQAAMLSLAGCVRPVGKIVPYSRSPEEIVPGNPLYFASALSYDGFARGILVECHTGRPTKIEGNPEHPDSLGATDALTQAAIYQLYDPGRTQSVVTGGIPSTWSAFTAALHARLEGLGSRTGDGLRFLSRPVVSPTLAYLRTQILSQFPKARWHQYRPNDAGASRRALLNLYGRELQPVYRLQDADVILSVESDILAAGPGMLAYSRQFSVRRETHPDRMNFNRLYAIESTPTLTGGIADHRVIVHPSEMEPFVYGLLEFIRTGSAGAAGSLGAAQQRFLNAAARDLEAHRGRSLVVAGAEQSENIHLIVALLNEELGNSGKTVAYLPPIEAFPEDYGTSINALINDLNAGGVSDLIIIDGNPAYAVPGDIDLAGACRKAEFSAYLGYYYDETAHVATWHIPMADELESWGDTRAFDGTVTVRQPVTAPLYNGVSDYEFCMAFLNREFPPYDEVLRAYWQGRSNAADFASFWKKTLHDGVMAGTAFPPAAVSPRSVTVPAPASAQRQWTLLIRPDPHILDGRFANNSWLQELPKPLTKLTWGNAALIASQSAKQLGLKEGDVVEITAGGSTVEAPVYVLPGQAPETMTVHLGYGRTYGAGSGNKTGFNAYALQRMAQQHQTTEFTFRKKKKNVVLATTQHHGVLSGERNILLTSDLDAYRKDPGFVGRLFPAPGRYETLYKPDEHLKGEYQWAMCIDLNRCTGCGTCTIACQVENNIAVVGKKEVHRNREMHWIRVDRYFKGAYDEPEIYHQPVPCMHCETAPCELVCPVEATSHSTEGLNEMTYNRCVGTRYCSNNCPYKVRRFNFFQYTHPQTTPLRLGHNPDVTIRPRGVMEKCTYCLQRINRARIAAKTENRRIRDGEVIPACQQACPTGAIVFGDLRDTTSRVVAVKANPLNYGMLEDTGARPRTTYLARIRNTNPDLAKA